MEVQETKDEIIEVKKLHNNTMALVGFILGILSAFVYALFSIMPILGIIFSGIGLGTFKPETQKNKWMAWAGLAISVIYFLMAVNVNLSKLGTAT